MVQLTDRQRDILVRTALGEARGQGVEGMADVIQVILNRAASGKYPSDPAAVATQPYQFSTWNRGEGGNNPQQFKRSDPIYKTAERALEAVVSGSRPDYTGGALFYHTPSVNPNWSGEVNRFGTVERNGHVFYPTRPVPPGEIPNVVASQLDTKPPARIQGKVGAPANNRATAAAPTQWFTPRLAPGNTDIYAYRIPDQRNTDLVGGKGSLTPTIGQRDPIPMPRPRPSTAVAGFPTPRPTYTPSPAQRLPELPPSNLASPRVVNASIERANAAVDPGLKRALEQRVAAPAMIDTSMKRAANAVDPALQRALDAVTRPAAPPMAKAPTGPALSRDSIAQAALGRNTVQKLGTTPFSPSPLPPAVPNAVPSAIPGPASVLKTADALPAGIYPAMAPAVATQLDVRAPVIGFPTPLTQRPAYGLAAAPPLPRPRPVMGMPLGQQPLKIAINGANSYSAPSTPTPFQGAATGRTYVPGRQYVMNGQTYSAKQGGGFVNDKTGREVAKGTGWQALHGLN